MQRRLGIVAILVVALAGTAAGCGGGGGSSAAPTEATTPAGGSTAAATGGTSAAAGDPAAGKEVFSSQGCATCHTLSAAGASGTIGPNLDDRLVADAEKAGQPVAQFARTSVVDPNAFVAEGYQEGVMPQDFGSKLSRTQLDDLVAFLVQATG